jgi:hypothetical protein
MKQRSLPLDTVESNENVAPSISREKLPTNTTSRYHSIHRWFNFIAGFSPEFVTECIINLPGCHKFTLLDPFAGCGTAPVEGLKKGFNVIGYEPHPIFARIARAKIGSIASSELSVVCEFIRKGFRFPVDPNTLGQKPSEFLTKLFNKETLAQLLGARKALDDIDNGVSDIAFLILSKIIELTSHSQTDGIYKAPTSLKKGKTPEEALFTVASMIKEDILNCCFKHSGERKIMNKSSTTWPKWLAI